MKMLVVAILLGSFSVLNLLSAVNAARIAVTRKEDGDEFVNPLGCLVAHCPSTSLPLTNRDCFCKCPKLTTWMQDAGKCAMTLGCDYTMVGNYIPAMAILGVNVDDSLSPETLLLYKGSKASTASGEYKMTGFQYLKDKPWASPKKTEENDFYFQQKGGGFILMERIQLKNVKDYNGAVINFTLTSPKQTKGCLLIKINGSMSYNAHVFPVPQVPTVGLTSQPVSRATRISTAKAVSPTFSTPQSSVAVAEKTEANPAGSKTTLETRTPKTEDRHPIATSSFLDPVNDKQKGTSSNTAAIVAGVVGGILGLALITAMVVFVWRIKPKRKQFSFGKSGGKKSTNVSNPIFNSKSEIVYEETMHDNEESLYEEVDSKQLKEPRQDEYEIPASDREPIYQLLDGPADQEVLNANTGKEGNAILKG
eukprot:m.157539 g.157539  ORF g.157539 m.157539 type:complete len:422 (+) comp38711_c0_seq2:848-2113(+)